MLVHYVGRALVAGPVHVHAVVLIGGWSAAPWIYWVGARGAVPIGIDRDLQGERLSVSIRSNSSDWVCTVSILVHS